MYFVRKKIITMNQISPPQEDTLKQLSPTKVILPILIGVGFTIYSFFTKYKIEDLSFLAEASINGILATVLVLAIRDFGYMYRIKHLTGHQLNWKSSFYSIMLWEFASAVTPSAVGGTVVATFILSKEGLSFGKAVAYVVITAVLDNLFFIVAGAVVLLIYQGSIFEGMNSYVPIGFGISYTLISVYTFFMAYGVFMKPRAFKWLLLKATSFSFTRRWRNAANEQGNEIILASQEIRGKDVTYWAKAALVTIFVWSARYLMLNTLVEAFTDQSLLSHLFIFAKNIVLWVFMLVSITPGASGQAELGFEQLYQAELGGYSGLVAIVSRIFSYYPYLLIGMLLLPRWIQRVFAEKNK
jgi:uncharacterized protein (TIRG00374 family)